jgi:CRP/FNR family cyclic AMP-dependent transcriptional regulator
VPLHSKLWYLQRFKLIDALDDAQRRLLEETTRMQEVRRGQRIYQPGDASEHMFLVKAGTIRIAAFDPSNREVLLGFRHPGDVFGELALLDDSPRDLAKAHEDSLICALRRDVVVRLARESPDVAFRVLTIMGRRIRQFRGRIEQLSYKSAAARIARALMDLADEHGVQDARGTVIAFKLSQGDLASLVGLTRETINAVLHRWQKKGVVEVDRRAIRLLDVDCLRMIQRNVSRSKEAETP